MVDLSIVIIGYYSKKYLDTCIPSLLHQTFKNINVLFIDNHSSDDSYDYVSDKYPDIPVVRNSDNLGYAKAANQGISANRKSKYVMIINPDVVLNLDYVEKAVEKMEEDEKIGAITGKVYKYDFEKKKKTRVIDSVGLLCFKNRRIVDEAQGIEDEGQFDKEKEVFGVSGACPIFRMKALKEAKVFGEYFDSDFFMYKEDIDLSWRLRLFGWKSYFLPDAKAYHVRGTGVLKRYTNYEVMKNRKHLNKKQKYYSLRNQRLMQVKNEFGVSFWKSLPAIIWKEILIFGYVVLREPYLLKAYGSFFKNLKQARKKRRYIKKNKKISSKRMYKWLAAKKPKYEIKETI